ncbi:hypothetical protein [Sinorhizobium meliloti]|jgi:hypothetical protein|uniref:J domain-containing protein n=1 Tax=Rhizobium meliloti TaxID=382 RepID=A0AAW9TEC3_RHIML|nr:hypothetical protein [Sinorhizobium meliloti]ASP88055.1 hypothetical protein CDO26_27215 [Sinorhizobium meliloti]MDE3773103.1 hypothetical protein [Sinorhizobium meliloti]MDW9396882.1 hypothetical protein [Sinorhizobium meliloti]MDW9459468.1 hypothetical protein [Sinorhizobium meliloti]MDW9778491.1 hypothetical protein [Sinorhizobium meliloti]
MFGMSVFHSVLERLKAEQAEELTNEARGGWRGTVIGAAPGFIAESSAHAWASRGAVEQAYRALAADERSEPFSMPDYLTRTSLAEVASELALGEAETALTLAAKRRRFAAANHPDRLPVEARLNATLRMKLANMLIDEALRRIEKPTVTG